MKVLSYIKKQWHEIISAIAGTTSRNAKRMRTAAGGAERSERSGDGI